MESKNNVQLLEGERLDDLQYENMRIIQKSGTFCFGMDAVLLADFAVCKKDSLVCDLGTGSGILPFLMYPRYCYGHMDAVEIQEDAADRARRGVLLNGLEQVISVHNADLRNIRSVLPGNRYDAVVCNPPYSKAGSALPAAGQEKMLARQDCTCTLRDVFTASAYLLGFHGKLYIVLPAARSGELFSLAEEHGLQAKVIRFVHSYVHSPARLILFCAMKGASSGVNILPPLVTKNPDGNDSDEVKRIYHQI